MKKSQLAKKKCSFCKKAGYFMATITAHEKTFPICVDCLIQLFVNIASDKKKPKKS